jgi:copper chaperone CopZ
MTQQAPGQVRFAVGGMSCGGCAAGVQRALLKAPGVRAAEVSFSAGRAAVEYDPARTDPERLAAVIAAAGHQVGPLS